MSPFKYVLLAVAICLLVLGAVSGIALVMRSLKPKPTPATPPAPGTLAVTDDDNGTATLWGMFIVGIASGLLLMWFALP